MNELNQTNSTTQNNLLLTYFYTPLSSDQQYQSTTKLNSTAITTSTCTTSSQHDFGINDNIQQEDTDHHSMIDNINDNQQHSNIKLKGDIFLFEEWRLIASFLPRKNSFGGLANVNRITRLAVLSVHFIRNSAVIKSFAIRWIWAQSINHYSDKLPNNAFVGILKPLQDEFYDLHQFVQQVPSNSIQINQQDFKRGEEFPIPNYYSRNLVKSACTIGNNEIFLQLIEKPFLFDLETLKPAKFYDLAFLNGHYDTLVAFTKALMLKNGPIDISKCIPQVNGLFIVPSEFDSLYQIVYQLFNRSLAHYQSGIIRIIYELLHSQLLETCHDENYQVGWTNLLDMALFNLDFFQIDTNTDIESAQFIIKRLYQNRLDNNTLPLFSNDLNRILLQIQSSNNKNFILWFFELIASLNQVQLLSNTIFDNFNNILTANPEFLNIYLNQFHTRHVENDEKRLYEYLDQLNTNYINLIRLLEITNIPYEKIANHLHSCAQYYLVNYGHVIIPHYESHIGSLIYNNIHLFLDDSKIHPKKRSVCLTPRVQVDLVNLFLREDNIDWMMIILFIEKNPFMSNFMEIIVSNQYDHFTRNVLDKIYSNSLDSDNYASRRRFIFKSYTRYIEKDVYDFCALLMFACTIEKTFMKSLLERNEYLIAKIHASFEPFENVSQMIERWNDGSFELISHDLPVLDCLCNSSLKVFVNAIGSLWPLSNNFLSLTFKILDESYEPTVRNNINDIRNIIRHFITSSSDIDIITSYFKSTIHQEEILNVLMGLSHFTKDNLLNISTPILARTKLTLDSLDKVIDIIYDQFDDVLEQKFKDYITLPQSDAALLVTIKYHPKAIALLERISYRHLFESSYITFFEKVEGLSGRGNMQTSVMAQNYWKVSNEPSILLNDRDAIMNLLSKYETIPKTSKWNLILRGIVNHAFIDELLEKLEEKDCKPKKLHQFGLSDSAFSAFNFSNPFTSSTSAEYLEESKRNAQLEREKQLSYVQAPLFNFTFDFQSGSGGGSSGSNGNGGNSFVFLNMNENSLESNSKASSNDNNYWTSSPFNHNLQFKQ